MRIASVVVFSTCIVFLGSCKATRINDARVSFMEMDDEQVEEFSAYFEKIKMRQIELEQCDNFIMSLAAGPPGDVSPCVAVILTTRLNPPGTKIKLGDQQILMETGFNHSNRLIIITHGFFQGPRTRWMDHMKDALLNHEDVNVILIDWNLLSASMYYPTVVQNSVYVAEYVAKFIDFFVSVGVDLKNIHMIGHSIGAHLVGVASQKSDNGIVGRITGLDAAKPLYLKFNDSMRLDASDADFVDCIHTSGGFLGIHIPFCHADFFVNGGIHQHGCADFKDLGRCGHLRATTYFTETISKTDKSKAYHCATVIYSSPITCWHEGALMGYPASKSHDGIFYVETGAQPPYHLVSSKEELEKAESQSQDPIFWLHMRS